MPCPRLLHPVPLSLWQTSADSCQPTSAAPSAPVPVADQRRLMPCPRLLHPVPRPCGRPVPTYASTGDTQTQFCLGLCGVPGPWYTQGLFDPSECLWWEWGLIPNMNSPLLPSCWGFSFAPGHWVSLHGSSSAYRLTGVSLTLDVRYLHTAGPEKRSQCC